MSFSHRSSSCSLLIGIPIPSFEWQNLVTEPMDRIGRGDDGPRDELWSHLQLPGESLTPEYPLVKGRMTGKCHEIRIPTIKKLLECRTEAEQWSFNHLQWFKEVAMNIIGECWHRTISGNFQSFLKNLKIVFGTISCRMNELQPFEPFCFHI